MAETSRNIRRVEFVVIVVLATALASAVLLSLTSIATRVEREGAEAEAHMIRTAVQVYALEQGLESVSFDDAAELDSLVSAVSTLIADDINGPDGSVNTKVITSVTIGDKGTVTGLVYVSSAGRTVIYDGTAFTVN